jgi:cyclic pyranopterin phosphate synthase
MADHIDLSEELRWAPRRDIQSRYKLLNNLDRVLEWTETGSAFPILVNMTLTNRCNHRCPLCTSKEYLDDRTMPTAEAKRIVAEVARLGAKAIGLGGGGDPTCHPDLAEMISFIGAQGLEVSLNTNGQLLDAAIIEAAVRHCTWIRVSLDGESPATFKKTHGLGAEAFQQVVDNIRGLVAEKRRTGSEVTLGVTYLLGPHTVAGAVEATTLVRDIGVDYMRLRPFFEWDKAVAPPSGPEGLVELGKKPSGSRAWSPRERELFQEEMGRQLGRCEALSTEAFTASYPRERALAAGEHPVRVHRACYVHHFETVVAADLDVYPCCMLEDDARYRLGSLRGRSFQELWTSEERRQAYGRIDFSDCPNPCMLEKHNELLWELKHDELRPGTRVADLLAASRTRFPHANFL